jgi:hypothetical protein
MIVTIERERGLSEHEPRSIVPISANPLSCPLAFRGLGHFYYYFITFYFIPLNQPLLVL